LQGPRPRRLRSTVGRADGDRHRAHRRAVPLCRAQGPILMIENRPLLTFFTHLILLIGVAIIALPVYVTFVASTLGPDQVLEAPMSLIPGTHLVENYATVLGKGASSNVTTAPVGRMMFNSLVTALVIACGKIVISLLSAF